MIAAAPTPGRSDQFAGILRANMQRLRRRCALAMKPHKPERPSCWIRRCVRLDKEREASSRVDFKGRPWWRDIVDAMWDSEVREISICAATQVGKTLMLICSILWCAENAPAPGMIVVPDRDSAIEFRDRLYAHAEATIAYGKVKRINVPPKRIWNSRYIDLGQMRVYLAWSGAKQRLRGRPCRYVWLTELDVYNDGSKKSGNPIAAAHQRTKAFIRGLHFHESSPAAEVSEISNLEARSSARYRWFCKCPKCGLHQELRFFPHSSGEHAGRGGIAGVKDEHGELHSEDRARANAHYLCLAGCKLGNELKQRLLETGRYVSVDCTVDQDGNIVGEQPPSRRSLGFQLWSVHSHTQTWGDLAASYIQAKEERRLPEWFGNWLGRSFKRDIRVPHWTALGKKLAGTNYRGKVPAEAWFLTAGSDVQGENNGVRFSIRGWAPGRTSWLIDWGWIDRKPGDENELVKSDMRELGRRVLDLRYPVVDRDGNPAVNPLGYSELPVRLLNCDSNFLPFKVHHWMRSLPDNWVRGESPRVRAVRGDHKLKPEMRWRENIVETNSRTGEVYEGGLVQWGLYVYPFYDELLQCLAGEANREGSWHVTRDCLLQGKAYLEQVANFGPRFHIDPITGKKSMGWDPRNGRIPVDFWDTEIYSLIAAYMVVGDLGWDVAKWETWREQRQQTPNQLVQRRRMFAQAETLGER